MPRLFPASKLARQALFYRRRTGAAVFLRYYGGVKITFLFDPAKE
jgi:hypothetical protein